MTYFIADPHFGHQNCLAYDNREFVSIEEHDAFLIENWNNVVNIDDDVWILGDISWHNVTKTIDILKSLNGNKHLCIGNHDKHFLKNKDFRDCFIEICDYKEIDLPEGKGLILCHYPIPCFKNHYYGWIHLYGHVHASFEWNMMKQLKYEMETLYDKPCRMFNVGCMIPGMDYTPRTLKEIIDIFENKEKTKISQP